MIAEEEANKRAYAAYLQGQQDQKNGVEFFLNPHVFETGLPSFTVAWSSGWMKSYQESKEVKK